MPWSTASLQTFVLLCFFDLVLYHIFVDPASPSEEREFAEWILFHAKVCNNKSERLVRMLCCQAQRLPMYLVLEAHSPGNLLLLSSSGVSSVRKTQTYAELAPQTGLLECVRSVVTA
jgi:hypothetical protein